MKLKSLDEILTRVWATGKVKENAINEAKQDITQKIGGRM